MNLEEFAKIVLFLEASTGKPIDLPGPKAQARMEVYFGLLGDLDYSVMMIAAQRVVLEHPWATFPSIAELRQAAAETIHGQIRELSPAEAWDMAWKAAGAIDLEIEGSFERRTEGLPLIVLEAMRVFGIPALCYGKEPVGVVRAQFTKIYEQLAARDKRRALFPPSVKDSIEKIGATEVAGQIGHMP